MMEEIERAREIMLQSNKHRKRERERERETHTHTHKQIEWERKYVYKKRQAKN